MSIRSITTIEQNNSSLNISFTSDLDKLSLTSDNDSGISSSSLTLPKISFLSQQKFYSTCLQCPTCLKIIYMDITDVKNLPKFSEQKISNHSIEHEKFFCQDHLNQLANFYCLNCRLECCQQCLTHNNHEMIPLHQAAKIYKVKFLTSVANQAKKRLMRVIFRLNYQHNYRIYQKKLNVVRIF